MADNASVPSRQVLDELPGRALRFLTAASTNPVIRAILRQRGYTDEVHMKGWNLLHARAGYQPTPQPGGPDVDSALTEIDAWDEPNFAVASAALESSHPAQHAFLFDNGLTAQRGAGSILSVRTFLRRVEQLETGKLDDGKERPKETRAADLAAVALLGERGITVKVRQHLASLIALVEKGHAMPQAPAPADGGEDERALALYRWYREWSAIAHAVVMRRDYKISLGIAQRRKPDKKDGGGEGEGGK